MPFSRPDPDVGLSKKRPLGQVLPSGLEFLDKGYFDWRLHALERAAERGISQDIVLEVLRQWDVVEKEHDRKPFPTVLVMGWNGQQPIHVVVAIDEALEWVYIITVYEPDLDHFESGFRVRKKQ